MALIFLPIAIVVGLVLGDVRRASRASFSIWLVAILALLTAKLVGAAVSPWEMAVLVVCLPPALMLARLAARLR
jgi:hypothetical protein